MESYNLHKSLGALVASDSTLFRVWAPTCDTLMLELQREFTDAPPPIERWPMVAHDHGFFELCLPERVAGSCYRFVFPNGIARPDPASRFQPDGVHGWSMVVDPHSYSWQDDDWGGVPKPKLVIYELHVGTFTDAGTYLAAIERLVELKKLGVTAIELMPLAASAGRWNWGYDGVHFFAPHHAYGSPDDLRRLVDAAHEIGLAVILDVVYNHFGPEGNYFRDFGPYISNKHNTAWGDSPNFDGDDLQAARFVRNYFIANLTYWIDEYHFDGLRVDAIHCMADNNEPHIVTELASAFDQVRSRCHRPLHLIAESNVYDSRMLQSRERGGHGYDAQWCDDFLHSVFAVVRPGEQMSQRHYGPEDMQATLSRGYTYRGSLSRPSEKLAHADNSARADLQSLVFSIQNHDFIGNHPLGQRLHQLTSPDAHRAAAAMLLLYPAIPMLFMGEEFACDRPFHFFVDYGEQYLREAVERGRRAEYPQHDWTNGASPLAPAAFLASKIGAADRGCADTWAWYQSLLAIRKDWQQLGLLSSHNLTANWDADQNLAHLSYRMEHNCYFLIARLNGRHEPHQPVSMAVNGTILLNQNCSQDESTPSITLNANAVLVGSGFVTTG